jgi:CRISPR system Cascade subunit CasB
MATTQTPSNHLEREVQFLQSIKLRTEKDKGIQSVFKRAISGEPEHTRRVYQFVLPYISDVFEWEQNHIWIPIACLSVFYPQLVGEGERRRDFGFSCRRLASETNTEGAERRFRALLDLSLTDIQSPLTALVRQMKGRSIPIDYPKLLSDLRQWERGNQFIQDRWARTFWSVEKPDQENAKEEHPMSE